MLFLRLKITRQITRRLQAWFAIAILALGALAPSISAALSYSRGDLYWPQVCSSSSSKQMPNPELDMLTQGHCAMCHLHAQDLALPPPAAAALTVRNDLAFAMPERFYSAPVTAHAWRAAQARAPPLNA